MFYFIAFPSYIAVNAEPEATNPLKTDKVPSEPPALRKLAQSTSNKEETK